MIFRKNLEMILWKISLSLCFAHSISKEINVDESTQPSVDSAMLLCEGKKQACLRSTCHVKQMCDHKVWQRGKTQTRGAMSTPLYSCQDLSTFVSRFNQYFLLLFFLVPTWCFFITPNKFHIFFYIYKSCLSLFLTWPSCPCFSYFVLSVSRILYRFRKERAFCVFPTVAAFWSFLCLISLAGVIIE